MERIQNFQIYYDPFSKPVIQNILQRLQNTTNLQYKDFLLAEKIKNSLYAVIHYFDTLKLQEWLAYCHYITCFYNLKIMQVWEMIVIRSFFWRRTYNPPRINFLKWVVLAPGACIYSLKWPFHKLFAGVNFGELWPNLQKKCPFQMSRLNHVIEGLFTTWKKIKLQYLFDSITWMCHINYTQL